MRGFHALLAAVGLWAPSGCGLEECTCAPCGAAVNFNVVDAEGNPVGDGWSLEATLDGIPVEANSCDPALRAGQSFCFFGTDSGVYRVLLHAAGRPDKEMAIRFPGRAGVNCCGACIAGETVVATLPQPGGTP